MSNLYKDENLIGFFSKHEKKIQGMLKTVNPETLKNEKQLKKTLKLLAMLGNVSISEAKIDQLVQDLKRHNFDPDDPNSLKKFIKEMKSKQ